MRPRQSYSHGHRDPKLLVGGRPRGSRSRVSQHHQDMRDAYPSVSYKAHRRTGQRHSRGVDSDSSRLSRPGHRSQQGTYHYSGDLESGQRQLDILDDLFDHKKESKSRRTKRTSVTQQQHGELLTFIRVFVSVILLCAILVIVVGFFFWVLYKLSCFASSFSLRSLAGNGGFEVVELGPNFVQNPDEIKRLLQVATKQSAKISKGEAVIHSVRSEEDRGLFELISHPGNPSIHVSVPRFYATVLIDNGDLPTSAKLFREYTSGKLLTPELASMIGSSVTDDPLQRTIFVSLLSSNDPNCPSVITNILNAAVSPSRVRIAVVDRTDSELSNYIPCDEPPQPCDFDPEQIMCRLSGNIDVYELRPDMDAGTIFRRHIANRMYRGEHYALQTGYNSNLVFVEGWDGELVQQLEATSNEMAIITTYLSDTANYSREADAVEGRPERYTLCHASFEGVMPNRRLMHLRQNQPEQVQSLHRKAPQLQPYWSSEFSFSRGHFILNVPYDRHICGLDEQEEEISMALRAFTHGYDFYTPTNSLIFRYPDDNADLNDKSAKPQECSSAAIVKSRHYLQDQLSSTNIGDMLIDVAGLGTVRTPQQFYKCFGIHMNEHITEHRMCEFVTSGNFHDEFTPHLQKNGMGLDYSDISFRFHELISIHKDSEQMS